MNTNTNAMQSAEDDFEEGASAGFAGEGEGGHFEAPKGFEVVSDDIAGYWDAACPPMEFFPDSIRLMDNVNRESVGRSSALIVGKLAKPATLVANTEDKADRHRVTFEAGTIVGIWAKPRMRELGTLRGCHVWIAPSGTQKMGDDRNDMQLFQIAVSEETKRLKGKRLQLTEDSRSASLEEPLSKKRQPWWLGIAYEDGGLSKAVSAKKANQAELAADRQAASLIS